MDSICPSNPGGVSEGSLDPAAGPESILKESRDLPAKKTDGARGPYFQVQWSLW